jgi:hypothetical protein
MKPATEVRIIWFPKVGIPYSVHAADPLQSEMAGLTAHIRSELKKNPEGFDCTAKFRGFAPTRVIFRSICPTAATFAFPSHTMQNAPPDVVCVLLNGLESRQEMDLIKSTVSLPPQHWEELNHLEKPVLAAAFNINNRMRDPATTTLIHVLGNVYFSMFGTNAVEDDEL